MREQKGIFGIEEKMKSHEVACKCLFTLCFKTNAYDNLFIYLFKWYVTELMWRRLVIRRDTNKISAKNMSVDIAN